MSYQVTASQIAALNSQLKNANDIANAINATTAKFGIDQQPKRVQYFVAQSFFETLSYTFWTEDLNYSNPSRLVAVWPSRFTLDPSHTSYAYAPNYVHNPQKLANLVYANRNGNGDTNSGDGWAFRGHGAFHLTFRGNYQAYDDAVYGDGHIVANPELVAQPTDAFLSAGWFWDTHHMNNLADQDAFTQATNVINGSTATVPQRLPVLNKVNAVLTW